MAQGMHKGGDNARTAGTNGVSQGAGSAINVDPPAIQADIVNGCHGDAGEGFVDFIQIHVFCRPAQLLMQLADRTQIRERRRNPSTHRARS